MDATDTNPFEPTRSSGSKTRAHGSNTIVSVPRTQMFTINPTVHECYAMDHERRGICLIVPNDIEEEVAKVELTFKSLGYEVERHNDDTGAIPLRQRLLNGLKDLSNCDTFALVAMSTREVDFQDIWDCLQPTNCPTMTGKPKLIFFQYPEPIQVRDLFPGVLITQAHGFGKKPIKSFTLGMNHGSVEGEFQIRQLVALYTNLQLTNHGFELVRFRVSHTQGSNDVGFQERPNVAQGRGTLENDSCDRMDGGYREIKLPSHTDFLLVKASIKEICQELKGSDGNKDIFEQMTNVINRTRTRGDPTDMTSTLRLKLFMPKPTVV